MANVRYSDYKPWAYLITREVEVNTLKEKLDLRKQIHALQRIQPAMNVKVPRRILCHLQNFVSTEGSAYKKLTKVPDDQVVLRLQMHMDADLKRMKDTNHSNW